MIICLKRTFYPQKGNVNQLENKKKYLSKLINVQIKIIKISTALSTFY